MNIIRTQDEIDNILNQCADSETLGESKYPGMTYEQGIQAAIDWLEGRSANPMQ